MKKAILYIIAFLVAACGDMEQYQNNPNKTTKAPASTVLTGILEDIYYSPWTGNHKINQFHCVVNPAAYWLGDQSYAWSRTGFGNYGVLRNVDRLDVESSGMTEDLKNAYQTLGIFFRAHLYLDLSERLGDIPFSEAMKSDEGIYYPKYDTQKDVYIGCLRLLDEANEKIAPLAAKGIKVEGDFMYEGNLRKWQKLINSYQLRILIGLSRRVDEADLDVKGRFNRIFSDPAKYPIMESNDDSWVLIYYDKEGNRYPAYTEEITNYNTHIRLSATYIELLTERQDPRVFRVASPTQEAKESGDPAYAEKFTSYVGADPSMRMEDLSVLNSAGKLSAINFDRYRIPTGEPCIQLGYAETMFNVAEAINRGWISGSAASYYEKGIIASMDFYGIPAAEYAAYLSQPSVVYQGNAAAGLEQILTQKYIAFFENSGLQAYYNYRRTGMPHFKVGEATGNNGVIPKRWMYPENEMKNNVEHLTEALNRQYNGADNINAEMWILK